MQLLKSLFFTAFMMVSALAFGGFMALCFLAPYRTQFAIARTWARLQFWLLGKVCGLTFTVEGRERIPAGNHIVMSNHTSAWETIAQFLIFPPQVWVLKRELLWIPLIGWGLKLLRPISINRGAGHRAVNQVIEQGKERLADGLWIIIFPEGTRVVAGEKRKYGVSGAVLATETGKFVVPLSHNASDFWVRRGIVKKAGTIRVVIGEPIPAAGKNARELNDEVRRAIEAGLARIAEMSTVKAA
ncbi:MAG TPA: lysophospholipid acyltransferase family protein [Steroidobacteraceae bacterium]|jgi:1-acyl-sn-glycerol-3-phosphate acyltransferase|nr:lysophospholipid acyltransferase family protein [Steroidobacteraceae bacterium]